MSLSSDSEETIARERSLGIEISSFAVDHRTTIHSHFQGIGNLGGGSEFVNVAL